MTTITEVAPGLTLITPQGKDRERMIMSLTVQMAGVIIRTGLPLDDEDRITLALCDKGFPVSWIAHLLRPSIDLARKALTVADDFGLEIEDRETLQ